MTSISGILTPGRVINAARIAARNVTPSQRAAAKRVFAAVVKAARADGRLPPKIRRFTDMTIDKLGQSPGHATSKKNGVLNTTVLTEDVNELYSIDVTAILRDKGSTLAGNFRTDINTRDRGIAYISGFKVRMHWMTQGNFGASPQGPCVVRWALVSPKNNTNSTIQSGFFRQFEESRDVDFSSSLSSMQKMNYPISTDKYRVLYQGKVYVGASSTTSLTKDPTHQNFNGIDRWFPIQRQFVYNDDSDQDCEDKIYMVWWCTPYMETTTAPIANGLSTQGMIVTHFRDPLEVKVRGMMGKRRRPQKLRNTTKPIF